MNNSSLARRFWLLVSFLSIAFGLTPLAASGANRQVTLPSTLGGIIGAPGGLGFAHQGAVGLVLGGPAGAPAHLVSFTVSDAAIADDVLLDDFPSPTPGRPTVFGMIVNEQSGLAAIFGQGANETHAVVAVSADAKGKLTKRWVVSYPNPNAGRAEAAINADGSIVYVFYNDSSPKVDKIRAEDGAVLGTIQLDDAGIDAGLTFSPVLKRLIVKTDFTNFFHVLKPEDDFAVDWRVRGPLESVGMKRGFVSADGRFLIGYGGFGGNEVVGNNFLTLDLASRGFRTLSLEGRLAPSGFALTFAPNLAALIVPYSSKLKVKNGGFSGCACGAQVADWIALSPDGSLTHPLTTQLAGDQQIIGPLNNAALSRTSAIAFLATMTRQLVAVDTLSGEVVSDQEVGDVFFIYRIGDTDTFLTTNGTNVLTLLDLDIGPSIRTVTFKKHKLTIEGERFLLGVNVQINGVDQVEATRNPSAPGREISVSVGKKDLPAGSSVTLVVTNRDGLSSAPFTVTP